LIQAPVDVVTKELKEDTHENLPKTFSLHYQLYLLPSSLSLSVLQCDGGCEGTWMKDDAHTGAVYGMAVCRPHQMVDRMRQSIPRGGSQTLPGQIHP
jgi:hypothetical protein